MKPGLGNDTSIFHVFRACIARFARGVFIASGALERRSGPLERHDS